MVTELFHTQLLRYGIPCQSVYAHVVFGLRRHFRSKPNLAFLTFVILSCTIFYHCLVCSISLGSHSNQPRRTGHPRLNIV